MLCLLLTPGLIIRAFHVCTNQLEFSERFRVRSKFDASTSILFEERDEERKRGRERYVERDEERNRERENLAIKVKQTI